MSVINITRTVIVLLAWIFLLPLLSRAQQLIIEFPTVNTIYQRDENSDTGRILIEGRHDKSIYQIEANFNNGGWITIPAVNVDGRFSCAMSATVGQGDLSIRIKEDPSVTAKVKMVSIGDIYIVAGQSNAAGWADTSYNILSDLPYTPVMYRRNVSTNWEILRHPASASGKGSPWPLVMSYLTKQHNMPTGVITTAIGGAWLRHWLKAANGHYTEMINTVRKATNGSMKVRAVLWFQGEADCNPGKAYADVSFNGDYDGYLKNLRQLVSDMHNDMKLQTVYVGQIGNVPHTVEQEVLSNRKNNYYIRKALQDSWKFSLISPGPVTYDIALKTDKIHIHFNASEEMIPLAERWASAISQYTYNTGTGRGPRLLKASFRSGTKTIKLVFDKRIKISDYKNNGGSKAEGWYLENGDEVLTDNDIISTSIRKNILLLLMRHKAERGLTLSYGIDHDGDGKKIIRGLNDLPAEPMYRVSLSK